MTVYKNVQEKMRAYLLYVKCRVVPLLLNSGGGDPLRPLDVEKRERRDGGDLAQCKEGRRASPKRRPIH